MHKPNPPGTKLYSKLYKQQEKLYIPSTLNTVYISTVAHTIGGCVKVKCSAPKFKPTHQKKKSSANMKLLLTSGFEIENALA